MPLPILKESSEPLLAQNGSESPQHQNRQRRRMVYALSLLLVALAVVLVKDRDFWFPSSPTTEVAEEDQAPPVTTQPTPATTEVKPAPPVAKASKHTAPAAKPAAAPQPQTTPVVTNRTALPPLQVEVVAGDEHRMVRPGSTSVKVDLQAGKAPPSASEPAVAPAASSTPIVAPATEAAERVRMSPNATLALTHPVSPNYPLLARQMKVQGSVIMQALISREGTIQDLQVLSGPAILAAAAREAVKQWRFKPYLQEGQAIETQAKITVNFTISTN
jgi:periplasmic protein TonB